MKIGWFLTVYGALGGVRSVIETGNALIRKGHEFYVLGNIGYHKSNFCEDLNPIDHHIHFSLSENANTIRTKCENYEFDLLFNQDPGTMEFSDYVNSKHKIIHYCGGEGDMYEQYSDREGIRTACSRKLIEAAEKHDPQNRYKKFFIGQGINFSEFHPMNPRESMYKRFYNSKKINILCCGSRGGSIRSNKGVHDIIEASNILGSDLYNFLYFDLTKQNMPPQFRCIETIGKQNTLKHIYALADIYVAPDYVSAWNCCAGESMACGKPVIASTKGIDDFGKDGETCLIYQEGQEDSPKILSDKIKLLANDSELRNRIAHSGRENIQKFSWDNVADRIIKMASELGVGTRI